MSTINPGTSVRLSAVFNNAAGDAADPTSVVITIKGDTETSYTYGVDAEVVKDSTGTYHMDYTVPAISHLSQVFAYKWVGTGAVIAAGEGTFLVTTHFPS